MGQDHTDPLFVEQEREKIELELVRAFKPQLATMHSSSVYCRFLKYQGLYAGPYADTSEDRHKKFARTAEVTHDGIGPGPSMNFMLDGSQSVFIPGLCKHAFNAGAAELNGAIGNWSEEYKRAYQGSASALADMAQSVSEAILRNDLNGALTAIYGRKWANYKLKSGPSFPQNG